MPAPYHSTLQMVNGEEVASAGGGGGKVGDWEGTHCLRSPPLPGHLLQVPGDISCSIRRWLVGSGMQPLVRQAEVGAADSGNEQGGSGLPDIGGYTTLFRSMHELSLNGLSMAN